MTDKALRRKMLMTAALFVAAGFLQMVHAQGPPLPPRPIEVRVDDLQPLAFGAFTTGASGGSVIMSTDYSRSATGTVILLGLGYNYTPARILLRGNPGTLVTVTLSPVVTLTRSGGGGTMTLAPGPLLPLSPFVLTVPYPVDNELLLGGTLSVGSIAANPAGSYSGTINITFNQQ